LLGYLNFLNNKLNQPLGQEEGELLFAFFSFKILTKLGYEPQLKTCLDCQKKLAPGKNYFNLKNGGLVCASCFSKVKSQDKQELLTISDNCVKVLRLILAEDFKNLQKIKIDQKLINEISNLTKGFLNYRF